MKIALYKGPADDWTHKIAHWAVCTFTASRYSHCELVIQGVCYSSSARDGAVRAKTIDIYSGKWDVHQIKGDETQALQWFNDHMGQPYDWAGVLRFAFPFLPHRSKQWFCSEACAAALGIDNPHKLTPADLAEWS